MHTFLLTLHVILSLLLVFIILMQPGKGADAASAFGGGGGSQIFGASGPGNLLTRGTGVIATLFMITSITLAFQSTRAYQAGGGVDMGAEDVEAGGGFGAPSVTPEPAVEPTPAAPLEIEVDPVPVPAAAPAAPPAAPAP
ncbi:MAG: preprotein translocase subunit SecG [Myxococcales bacterium]|nr:preprotein translocase subunit SecG [Myxococcales bacterium]